MNFLVLLASLLISSTVAFAPRGVTVSSTQQHQQRGTTISVGAMADRDSLVMMPATLDREVVKVGRGGPAVLDRPEVQRKSRADDPTKERKHVGHEAWEVRIYNDGLNTREHVARSLVQVTGMSEISAYQTMMQAHQNGIAVVGRYFFEIAEMYQEALQKQGIVCDIVPVEEEK